MVALIKVDDSYRMNKIGRVNICEVCPFMTDINLVCEVCNCANNKHVFLQEEMDCPKNYWTKLK